MVLGWGVVISKNILPLSLSLSLSLMLGVELRPHPTPCYTFLLDIYLIKHTFPRWAWGGRSSFGLVVE
jgi:hypothetical protein